MDSNSRLSYLHLARTVIRSMCHHIQQELILTWRSFCFVEACIQKLRLMNLKDPTRFLIYLHFIDGEAETQKIEICCVLYNQSVIGKICL